MIQEYKGYQIKPFNPVPSSYVIVTAGKGGKIPNVMEGVFTTRAIAMQLIDQYVTAKETENDQKGNKRGV